MMPQTPQTAVITGASAGLGRALAIACARTGYRLVLIARSASGLAETAAAADAARAESAVGASRADAAAGVAAAGSAAPLVAANAAGAADPATDRSSRDSICLPADITDDPAALAQRVALAAGRDAGPEGGRIDLLINNAGVGSQAYFMQEDPARLQTQIDVNFTAPMLLTRALRDSFTGGSKILNIASTAGLSPGPGMALYYAAKAAMISWSRALEYELREQGVAVTTFCPGPLQTSFPARAGVKELGYLRRAPTAEKAARDVLRRVSGRGGLYVYPAGFRILSVLQRLLPQRAAIAAVFREQRRRGLGRTS